MLNLQSREALIGWFFPIAHHRPNSAPLAPPTSLPLREGLGGSA